MLKIAPRTALCLAALACHAQTAPPKPNTISPSSTTQKAKPPLAGFGLEEGTPVRMRLTRNLSSADDNKGDQVDFETLDDVVVDGVMVIPKGSTALATITEAEHKKRMGRGGKLNVNVDYVRLRDGEHVALSAIKDGKGGGHIGAMTGAMVATGIVFFPAAPLFLFMHGKDINIPKGTEVTAYVNGNILLDRAKFEEKPGDAQSTSAALLISSQTTNVNISSNPAGADIEVDGNFSGNSPSTLRLSGGEHVVKVSKAGYQTWERKVRLSGGSISLVADLEAVTSQAAK